MVKRRRLGKWLVTIVVLAGLAGGGYYYFTTRVNSAGPGNEAAVRTSPVIRGSISSMVSGSGSVATSREQALTAPGASTLLEIHVEDGDRVTKGDVLFVLDCPEVVSSQQAVSKYEYQLAEYYAAKNELQRFAEREYLVTAVNARVGDKLAKNGALMSLLDISTMTIQVPAEEGASWEAGQNLQVTLLEYGNTVNGTLTGAPTFSRNNGMDYLTFTLTLDKGQRIGGETYGQAYNRTVGNQAAVMLKPNTETQIKSPADGYLEELNAAEGEIMPEGTLMYRIDSTNLDSQISDANSEMQVAMSNLKQKQTTLTADFDGIYYAAADSSGPKNTFLQTGDSLKSSESLGKIVDSERMQIVFNVDELDIAKVEIGQEVKVVADALPNVEYTGRVARISQEGASSGNVAYYWVLIEVTEWEGLKVGMTSSLEIVVEKADDTLMVPINAVRTLRGIKYVILAEDQSGAGEGTAAVQGGQPIQSGQPGQGEQPAQSGQPGQGEQPAQSGDGASMQRQRPDGATAGDGQAFRGSPPDGQTPPNGQTPPDGQAPQGGQGTQGEFPQGTPLDGQIPQSEQLAQDGTGGQPEQGGPARSGDGSSSPAGSDNPAGNSDNPAGSDNSAGSDNPAGSDSSAGSDRRPGGDGSGMMNLALPERAVIVQTGIINDTYVEILSGLSEGQIVELVGSAAANSNNFFGGDMMFIGPGPVGGTGANGTVTMTRDAAPTGNTGGGPRMGG